MSGEPPRSKPEAVLLYPSRRHVPQHESVVHRDIAMRIADLLDIPFDGIYDETRHTGRHCYFVPSGTLIAPALKERLGITGEYDLFGGYADHAFMPTKAITHGLVGPMALRPAGWSESFSRQMSDVTLRGYTAFSVDDLRNAVERLISEGHRARLKPVEATAGRGQVLIEHLQALEDAVSRLDKDRLAECGIVVEAHLENVVTYSVGQVRLPGLVASYIGTQCLTRDNHGHEVYGGSRLQFARGTFDALQGLPLPDDQRRAVELARRYDQAADDCYPDFFASRRNYDVASGTSAHGLTEMGVLEQSWRIGGASRAEIAALEVFTADPECKSVWAETLEIFGDSQEAPPHAVQTFAGDDPDLGLIRKYVMVEAYGDK